MKIRTIGKAAALAAIACGAAWGLLPQPRLLEEVPFSTVVRDRDGCILRVKPASDGMVRVFAPLDKISPRLIRATLFQEDRHFAEHPGVNPLALMRAAWHWLSGPAQGGASTVTMQVARLRQGLHTRSIPGKCAQIFDALCLERHYSKQQILEAYFNLAPYGGNIEGAAAASWLYLGRAPDSMSWAEAVSLSVIPQSPASRRPLPNRDNASLAAAHRRLYERMLSAGIVSDRLGRDFSLRAPKARPMRAPHFVNGLPATVAHDIVTTLDGNAQELLETCIRRYVQAGASRGVHNAAAMLLDARSMEVLASVGSADFWNVEIAGQVDGTRSLRSPGSALKPFIYALALDEGIIHPRSLLIDAPARFGDYSPDNFDREFCGPLTATDALARSRNVPAVALASRLHQPDFYTFLRSAGLPLRDNASSYGLSIALGGKEVTMEDMARLYATLANGGVLKPVAKMRSQTASPGRRILGAEAAWLTLDMLSRIPAPGTTSADPSRVVSWKTGTSHGFRDAWSVGVFDHYALAVWVGNSNGKGNPEFVGGRCAAPLFFRIIQGLESSGIAKLHSLEPPAGANLRRVDFCAVSGKLPGPDCSDTVTGWFIPGVSPISTCDVHREVLVDAQSGLRVLQNDGNCRREVFEFWPTNVLRLYEQAGVPRRTPPPFAPGCGFDVLARNGASPQIVSPTSGASYAIRPENAGDSCVSLAAHAEADVRKVHWFANSEYLGSAPPGQSLPWHARPGRWHILALDDKGRSSSRELTVIAANR